MLRLLKTDAQKARTGSWGESTFMQADTQLTVQGQRSWSKVTLQIEKQPWEGGFPLLEGHS